MKHYGIWSPERGWYWASHSKLFMTPHECIAMAQLDIAQRQWAISKQAVNWRVRDIEEWAQSMEQVEGVSLQEEGAEDG